MVILRIWTLPSLSSILSMTCLTISSFMKTPLGSRLRIAILKEVYLSSFLFHLPSSDADFGGGSGSNSCLPSPFTPVPRKLAQILLLSFFPWILSIMLASHQFSDDIGAPTPSYCAFSLFSSTSGKNRETYFPPFTLSSNFPLLSLFFRTNLFSSNPYKSAGCLISPGPSPSLPSRSVLFPMHIFRLFLSAVVLLSCAFRNSPDCSSPLNPPLLQIPIFSF